MRMKQHFLFIASLMFTLCQADRDVEDLIAQGYTCSLADYPGRTDIPRPGVEIVCDDGICAKCIKNRGVTPSPTINKEDPEDYLLDGFVCSEEFRNSPNAANVCDDGHCVGCKVIIVKFPAKMIGIF